MENYESLKALVLGAEEDAHKFFVKKNSAAGTRLRKTMQEIKGLSQDIRNQVTNIKNADKGKLN